MEKQGNNDLACFSCSCLSLLRLSCSNIDANISHASIYRSESCNKGQSHFNAANLINHLHCDDRGKHGRTISVKEKKNTNLELLYVGTSPARGL